MRKKVVILFNGSHLSYSPTVITLYDLLSKYFDVSILADSSKTQNLALVSNRDVAYKKTLDTDFQYRINRFLIYIQKFFDKRIALLQKMGLNIDHIYGFLAIRNYLLKKSPDFVIAVDFRNLFYTQMLERKVEFLSLEIIPDDFFYENCDFSNLNSVIIQTKDRYDYLFGDRDFKTFFIQNAPIYTPPAEKYDRKDLIYCGRAWNPFGFYKCLEFLRKFPNYKLFIQGALTGDDKSRVETEYKDLISHGQLNINSKYLDEDEITDYLRKFRIGFCFYNFEVKEFDVFNFHTAPSGKMFKYFAAGVPAVGVKCQGLQPIADFEAGVLIKDLGPDSIKQAIDKIESNYDYYSQNCLKAAEHYSFDRMAEPFIEYLRNKN